MPTNFEFEFNQDDKDLIISQQENSSFGDGALFSVRNFDYIRLTIYPTEGLDNIVTLPNNTQGVNGKAIFFSSLSETSFYINIMPFIGGTNVNDGKLIGGDNNDFKIYKKDIPGSPSEIYIKPNDVFEQFELPQGNYRIQIDFLNQVKTPIQTPDQSDLSEYTESYLIENAGQQEITWTLSEFIPTLNNMPAEIFRIYNSNFQEIYYRNDYLDGNFDNPNYGQPLVNGEIYYIQLAQSNFAPYTWNPLVIPNLDASETYNFIIKQISTSRKEVRLKLFDKNITNDSSIITDLTNVLNGNELQTVDAFNYLESNPPFLPDGETPNPNYKYQFKHVLNVGTGDHVPIMNYTFDRVTDGKNNQSIILKLYEPLTTAVSNLQMVTIEKEVLTTQIQDIYYFSDVPDVFFGDGLIPDTQQNWISPDNNQIGFESLDELAFSASIGEIETNYLISQSEYNYPNLNTDFNEYENHTFFGSAKKKLVNFKTKVETIQSYYTDISSSLVVSSSIDGDSTYIINYRKNLFNKINDEFKTFTPYERFLYYDGQSDTTASAPSLVNLSHKKPLTANDNYLELNQHDK